MPAAARTEPPVPSALDSFYDQNRELIEADRTPQLYQAVQIPNQAHPATIVRLAPSTDRVRQYQRICALEAQGLLPKLRIAPVDFRPGQMLSGSQEVPK
jgi:hypothetical protein